MSDDDVRLQTLEMSQNNLHLPTNIQVYRQLYVDSDKEQYLNDFTLCESVNSFIRTKLTRFLQMQCCICSLLVFTECQNMSVTLFAYY